MASKPTGKKSTIGNEKIYYSQLNYLALKYLINMTILLRNIKGKDADQPLARIGPGDIDITEEEWKKRHNLLMQIRQIGGKEGAGLRPFSERKLKSRNTNTNVLVGDPKKKKIAGGRGNFLADLSNKLSIGPKKP